MTEIMVEWRLAGWAECILVVLLGLALAGLSAWLVLQAVKDVLDRAARVEEQKAAKTEKALEEWMETFREEHAKRIAAELQKTQGFIKSIDAKLANENFVAHAPAAIVEGQKTKRAELVANVARLEKLAKLFA